MAPPRGNGTGATGTYWAICVLGLGILPQVGCQTVDSLSADPKVSERRFEEVDNRSLGDRAEESWRYVTGRGPDRRIAEGEFTQGEELYKSSRYEEAAAKFREAGKRWPDSPLEEDALFLEGEAYFFADRYYDAVNAYSKLLNRYENSRHLDAVGRRMFVVARFWETEAREVGGYAPNMTDDKFPAYGWQQHAGSIYQTVHLQDPTGTLADDTLMARGNLSFVNGEYEDAAYYYETLRRDYPRSEHLAKAHLLEVQAQLNQYQKMHNMQGAIYEGRGLDEADKVSRTAVRQFSGELADEREDLIKAQDQVYQLKAERQYNMAKYYHRRGKYRASRYYCYEILKDYPDTGSALTAKNLLQDMQGLPDEEPNSFEWLAKPFRWLEPQDPLPTK